MQKGNGSREKPMKKHGSTIALIVIFFVGLSVLLYPTVSDLVNQRNQSRAVAGYQERAASMTQEDYDAYFSAADDYNQRLAKADNPLGDPDQVEGYEETLDISGTGIMGYITIDKIGVQLPVYHGISDQVLAIAAGHLPGSSLPVGGKGTHAVISAHRGLPSAKLFTNLDQLQEGDTFTITVLNRVLTYEVDQISIVLPENVDDLAIEEGQDYCTLLTCTPYGINTHRLLVRGHRIATEDSPHIYVTAEAYQIEPIVIVPFIAAPLLLLLLLGLLARNGRKRMK